MQNTDMQGSAPNAAAVGQDLAERATSKLGQLSDTAHQTMERFSHAASQAASRLSEKTHDFWESQGGPAVDEARAFMRAHPVATIGIAVVVGLVLARLVTRR
jgi:ElaB/YqjD/DUF883 family membrane-anchored ribosome-binding protein